MIPLINSSFSISWIFLVLISLCFLSSLATISVIRVHRGHKVNSIRVDQYQQRTELLSSYLLAYVFVFLGLNFSKSVDAVAFLVFFWMLWVIQSRSEMLHINPILAFFNYRIYEVTNNNRIVLVISDSILDENIKIPESQKENVTPEFHNIDVIPLGPSTYITPHNHEEE